jgi:transcriptional regulator with XRE-family HTH domain
MELGDNMMLLRKKKNLSQADLGKLIGTSGDVIGRYERGDIKPSIEVATNIAEALQVSIDYLVGKTKIVMDKETVDRLEDIAKLPEEKKNYVFGLIDMALRDFKAKRVYATK